MSSRRPKKTENPETSRLRSELETLKQQSMAIQDSATDKVQSEVPAFEKLSGTEQAAGSLGVHVDAWKPIRFMNNAHFNSLVKANALDDGLARRIEAFRTVAAQ